jgi:hypothetical protein
VRPSILHPAAAFIALHCISLSTLHTPCTLHLQPLDWTRLLILGWPIFFSFFSFPLLDYDPGLATGFGLLHPSPGFDRFGA